MTRYRSALLAGLLGLAVAVCDDGDGTVTQPPPVVNVAPPVVNVDVPPAPPVVAPLTAMITPASAEVGVDGMVDFAVGTSGGSGDVSWTCTSSDAAVATVETTDTGCRATAVAGGGATITAAVTKGSETTNVAANLTVSTTADAFIIVTKIESDGTGNDDVQGTVNVEVNVERGNQTFERLSLNVDGMEVDAQDFGTAAAAEDAEQSVHTFTLSFDSDGYEEHGDHTDVAYMNGEHSIQATLKIAGRDEALMSNVIPVEFKNKDGYVVMADLGDNSTMGNGNRWYGGPSNGMIEITALPVLYSGGSVSSVTVGFCGKDETDSEAPFTASFECKDFQDSTRVAINEDGNILKGGGKVYIDNKGPENAPIILANRNGREEGWINSAVGLTGKYDATKAKDNWLVEGEGGEGEGGVGGYNMMVRIGKDLKTAVGDDASYSLPAESDDNEAYCAVAVATDDLGNMTALPKATATCRAAPAGADVELKYVRTGATDSVTVYGYDDNGDGVDTTIDPDDVSEANGTLKFGVDTTNPVIELADDEAATRFAVVPFPDGSGLGFDVFDDENDDGNSGLTADGGLRVKVNRRTATKSDCAAVQANGTVRGSADDDCEYMVITDDDVNFEADSLSVAYYTVGAMAKDKAGNTSSPVSHTLVYDIPGASATAPAVPGVVAAGKPFQGSSYLNDNLSIRDYYGTMDYGTGTPIRLGIGLPLAVDAFNAASFTRLNHAVTAAVSIITGTGSTMDPYKALQTDLGAALTPLSTVTIFVRDQAQAAYGAGTSSAELNLTGAADTDDDFDSGAFTIGFQGVGDDDDYEVCGYAKCTDSNLSSTLSIQVRAVMPTTGSTRDPFERVDFWVTDINGASWIVGSDTSGTSGRNDARARTWSYSVRVPGTMLRMATRPGTGGTETAMIRAIGVNDEGVGLVTSVELAAEDFGTEDTSD